jgi:pyridoxal biosynthesis lyase PdxS
MCSGYNREGGADCSKQKYRWIQYLIFQLSMVTIMYLAVVLFEINGAASPFNVIITYIQLSVNGIMVGSGL